MIADRISKIMMYDNDLFIRGFSINWKTDIKHSYVANIKAIRSIRNFEFSKPVTIFVGENGSGKSTLIEALAVASGLNPEGGSSNYNFCTYDDYSDLYNSLQLIRGIRRPKLSYFFRAETFYNVATATNLKYRMSPNDPLPDYHARSHGESFLDFLLRENRPLLYYLDEPEAALSPQNQLALLCYIVRMSKMGAQFIIATHSPILTGIPDADILSFDNGKIHKVAYEETGCYYITKMFMQNRQYMLDKLLGDDEDEELE